MHMRWGKWRLAVVVFAALLVSPVCGFAGIISFDALNDLDVVTNQFQALGVTFMNALVLRSAAGVPPGSLNEIDFPPHSDFNVIMDDSGPIAIDFSPAVFSASAFFTYVVPLTLEAFDAGHNPLGTVHSACSANYGSLFPPQPGCSPNELLSFSGVGSIAQMIITGESTGSSFTLDDLTFDHQQTVVPEPGSLILLVSCIGLLGLSSKLKRS